MKIERELRVSDDKEEPPMPEERSAWCVEVIDI